MSRELEPGVTDTRAAGRATRGQEQSPPSLPRTETDISLHIGADVIAGQAPLTSLQDRIVFVSATPVGNRNIFVTPLDTLFAGVEVQATVADNLLRQDFVHRPANGRMFESLSVVGLGMTVTLLATTISLSAGAITALVGLSALWIGAVWLLSTSGVFLSPFYATAGAILALLFVTVGKVGLERRRAERAIRKVEIFVLNR